MLEINFCPLNLKREACLLDHFALTIPRNFTFGINFCQRVSKLRLAASFRIDDSGKFYITI